jgi:hypothetical protein
VSIGVGGRIWVWNGSYGYGGIVQKRDPLALSVILRKIEIQLIPFLIMPALGQSYEKLQIRILNVYFGYLGEMQVQAICTGDYIVNSGRKRLNRNGAKFR